MKEILCDERLENEVLRVSRFIERVYNSDGDKIIPIIGDRLGVLHIRTKNLENNSEIHCLTLLKDNDDKELIPVGWLGFETNNEKRTAEFVCKNMSSFCLDGGMEHKNIVADKKNKIIYLPKVENKYFSGDFTKNVFGYWKVCVAIEDEYQYRGFGTFLVQLAGNLAKIDQIESFGINHNISGCKGSRMYERAFGLEKIKTYWENGTDKSWYFDIKDHNLPKEEIAYCFEN